MFIVASFLQSPTFWARVADCREAKTLEVSVILLSPRIVDVGVTGFDGISLQSFSADAFVAVVDYAVNAGVLSSVDKSHNRKRRRQEENRAMIHDLRLRNNLDRTRQKCT